MEEATNPPDSVQIPSRLLTSNFNAGQKQLHDIGNSCGERMKHWNKLLWCNYRSLSSLAHIFFLLLWKRNEKMRSSWSKKIRPRICARDVNKVTLLWDASRNLIRIQNTNISSKTWIGLAKTTASTRPKRSWSEEFGRYVDKVIFVVLLSRIRRNVVINEALFCRAKLSTSSNGRDIHKSKHLASCSSRV